MSNSPSYSRPYNISYTIFGLGQTRNPYSSMQNRTISPLLFGTARSLPSNLYWNSPSCPCHNIASLVFQTNNQKLFIILDQNDTGSHNRLTDFFIQICTTLWTSAQAFAKLESMLNIFVADSVGVSLVVRNCFRNPRIKILPVQKNRI